jgi:hypothetical protein
MVVKPRNKGKGLPSCEQEQEVKPTLSSRGRV